MQIKYQNIKIHWPIVIVGIYLRKTGVNCKNRLIENDTTAHDNTICACSFKSLFMSS